MVKVITNSINLSEPILHKVLIFYFCLLIAIVLQIIFCCCCCFFPLLNGNLIHSVQQNLLGTLLTQINRKVVFGYQSLKKDLTKSRET